MESSASLKRYIKEKVLVIKSHVYISLTKEFMQDQLLIIGVVSMDFNVMVQDLTKIL